MDPIEKDAGGRLPPRRNRGASLVEYALLCMLIAMVAVVAVQSVGVKVSTRFSGINSAEW